MAQRELLLLIDGDHVSQWQLQALERLPVGDKITVLSCTNTHLKRQIGKHLLYYALNIFTVRNPFTKMVPIGDLNGRVVKRVSFESEWDGNWQRLPKQIIDQISGSSAVAVIKFGLGLMRVPAELSLPILSYHHGDPDKYRGRPAGFYEMESGEFRVGQIIQQISNKLDAGKVLAFAETRVLPHSWRATLIESFKHSPYLLETAIANAVVGQTLPKPSNGKNFRLPNNISVIRHVGRAWRSKGRRITYGLFFEKQWRVAMISVTGPQEAVKLAQGHSGYPARSKWQNISIPKGYSFAADPFFAPDGGILLEAMNANTGKGEIVYSSKQQSHHRVSVEAGHFSYPTVVEQDGAFFCVPEIAEWSAPIAYPIVQTEAGSVHFGEGCPLALPEGTQLTDPTFLQHHGKLWLFANRSDEGSNVLRLWCADTLFDEFREHPNSPIRVSCHGGRMAGNLMAVGGRLFRPGQIFDYDYGNGVVLFEIDLISQSTYLEREVGSLQFSDCKGPHTFNLSDDGTHVVFDWYLDRFTPMAGVRRIRSRLGI